MPSNRGCVSCLTFSAHSLTLGPTEVSLFQNCATRMEEFRSPQSISPPLLREGAPTIDGPWQRLVLDRE